MTLIVKLVQLGPNLKWTRMVKNEPNFKTFEITKCAKVLTAQSDQNLKWDKWSKLTEFQNGPN